MAELEVYLGLGSNLGDSQSQLQKAFEKISSLPDVSFCKMSSLYKTSPVSSLPQNFFINAVCYIRTQLSVLSLFAYTQEIEKNLGKIKKPKDHPRMMDIDIIFYGEQNYRDVELTIPHPEWKNRLFVLIPLAELDPNRKVRCDFSLTYVTLTEYIANFPNSHNEKIEVIS